MMLLMLYDGDDGSNDAVADDSDVNGEKDTDMTLRSCWSLAGVYVELLDLQQYRIYIFYIIVTMYFTI